MNHQHARATMAQINLRAERDATNMTYALGISLALAVAMMSLAWMIPALYA